MSLIDVKKLSKKFKGPKGELLVIDDISFGIEDKEFLAIVGPSGCGKSTLLRIIAGLDSPTSGEVLFHEKPIIEPSTDISMVFQNFALLPWKTARENVMLALGSKNMKESKKEKIVNELLEHVGLKGFEDVYPGELSGGMKQRVGIARALSVSPEVLLLDEPFSSLDEITANELRKQILHIWSTRGSKTDTFVLITHLVEEAVLMADSVIVMSSVPAKIVADIKIDIPRPRFNNIRSEEFFSKCDEISTILKKYEQIPGEYNGIEISQNIPK